MGDEEKNGNEVEYRRELAAVCRDVAVMKASLESLKLSFEEKHQQNRRDIHRISNFVQDMMDKVNGKMDDMRENFNEIKLGVAKNRAYWLGIWAAIVVGWEVIKTILEHAWK